MMKELHNISRFGDFCLGFCSSEQLMELFHCRARRRVARGLKRKPMTLIKRLRKAKKEAGPLEKPEVIVCACLAERSWFVSHGLGEVMVCVLLWVPSAKMKVHNGEGLMEHVHMD